MSMKGSKQGNLPFANSNAGSFKSSTPRNERSSGNVSSRAASSQVQPNKRPLSNKEKTMKEKRKSHQSGGPSIFTGNFPGFDSIPASASSRKSPQCIPPVRSHEGYCGEKETLASSNSSIQGCLLRDDSYGSEESFVGARQTHGASTRDGKIAALRAKTMPWARSISDDKLENIRAPTYRPAAAHTPLNRKIDEKKPNSGHEDMMKEKERFKNHRLNGLSQIPHLPQAPSQSQSIKSNTSSHEPKILGKERAKNQMQTAASTSALKSSPRASDFHKIKARVKSERLQVSSAPMHNGENHVVRRSSGIDANQSIKQQARVARLAVSSAPMPTQVHSKSRTQSANSTEKKQADSDKKIKASANATRLAVSDSSHPLSPSSAHVDLLGSEKDRQRAESRLCGRPGAAWIKRAPRAPNDLTLSRKQINEGPSVSAASLPRPSSAQESRTNDETLRVQDELNWVEKGEQTSIAALLNVVRGEHAHLNTETNEDQKSSDSLQNQESVASGSANTVHRASRRLSGLSADARRFAARSGHQIKERNSGSQDIELGIEATLNDQSGGETRLPNLEEHVTTSAAPEHGQDGVETELETEELDVQVGLPVVFPGAFAVTGLNHQNEEGYQSDDIHSYTPSLADEHESRNAHFNEESLFAHDESSPFEATLAEEVVVQGAIITDELDPKTLLRLRFMKYSIILFSLTSLGLVIMIILASMQGHGAEEIPEVTGWQQVGPVIGMVEEPQSVFGTAVAISGDGEKVVVVSPGQDNGDLLNVGALYVFRSQDSSNGTDWLLEDDFHFGPGAKPTTAASLAISSDASLVAVGYPDYGAGAVAIYKDDPEMGGVLLDHQLSSATNDEAWFGYSVALSPDGLILAVGAPRAFSGDLLQAGLTYIYKREGEQWMAMGQPIPGEAQDEFFGWSVAVTTSNGVVVAIGSPVHDEFRGRVSIFAWNVDSWVLSETFTGENSMNRFGDSIDLSHDGYVLAVGARGSFFEGPGYVEVFTQKSVGWSSLGDKVRGKRDGEGFGAALELSARGDILVIGSPLSHKFGEESGIVQVFEFDVDTNKWHQVGSDVGFPGGGRFGSAVAVSSDGSRIVGGAPFFDFNEQIARSGSAWIFDLIE